MKKINRKNIAIILNNNARNVNMNIKEQIEQIIPKQNIFYTNSLEEADATIAKILNSHYTHIFTGGGDGTLVYFINKMKEIKRKAKIKTKLPAIGILRLGTGNAVAIYTNSGKKIADDLEIVLKGGTYKTDTIDFVKIDDKYFTFGGFGADALVLNDYDMMKRLPNKILRYPFAGLKGYFLSALAITLPKIILKNKENYVEIYANNNEVYAVSMVEGFRKIEVKKGDLIYKGSFTSVVIGTTPFYGYGLKALPFANKKKGFLQIRILDIPPVMLAYKVLKAWNGLYSGDDIIDFVVQDVTVKFKKPTPLQIAGEAAGYKEEARISLSKEKIDFIKFEN
jgi:diacylglycerol kinase family enzyme